MWPACVLKQDPESFVFRNRFILTHFESLSGWWTRILGSSCRYGLIYHASLVGQSAPALKARTGDGIGVWSLCWLHMFVLSKGNFRHSKWWNIQLFSGFFPWITPLSFLFLWGCPGFQKKVSLFFWGQTAKKHGWISRFGWVPQGKISRVLAAKLSLCCRVDALGDQATPPDGSGLMGLVITLVW